MKLSAIAVVAFALCCLSPLASSFKIGTALHDVTGPVVEVGFMGYAMLDQKGSGLHTRLQARAFVFADDAGTNVVAFVSADICMGFHGVKAAVVKALQDKFAPNASPFSDENVMVTGTHTHAGPGGFSYYILYDLTVLGFQKDNFNFIVNGISQAIFDAYTNMHNSAPGASIEHYTGALTNSNINRSPSSYLLNSDSERAQFTDNVDKDMTILRLKNGTGSDIGLINWFAVHGTSMTNKNTLVSGDNKGYASALFEKIMNGPESLTGEGPYVAAFAQTNSGDVSPRTRGAFCSDGTPCEIHSTCGGKNENCNGIGPGDDEYEATQIIGAQQVQAALEIAFNSSDVNSIHHNADILLQDIPINTTVSGVSGPTSVNGDVRARHTYLDMENLIVTPEFSGTGQNETTCLGAMGDSFAAGTTDGPGAFSFIQGENSSDSNPFFNFVAHFLSKPSAQQISCQHPKPILFNTGGISFPAPWTVRYQPVQILQVGNVYLLGVPGEFTTMSGRRLRTSTRAALQAAGVKNPIVIIAEIANSYGGYVTTREEYQAQRYEAASTIYGPATLAGYQQSFATLATAIATNSTVNPGTTPPDLSGKTFNFLPGVIYDSTPSGKNFGDLEQDVQKSYSIVAKPVINATFWGSNPRTDFWNQYTFMMVERLDNDSWILVATDAEWETKFIWKRSGLANSLVSAVWSVPSYTKPGTYRIGVAGQWKSVLGVVSPYTGYSSIFELTA